MNFLLYLDPCAHAAQYNSKHESQKCHIISYIKWNFVETSNLCDSILKTHKIFELQADISLKVETNFITLIKLLVEVEVKHHLTLGQKQLPYLYPHKKLSFYPSAFHGSTLKGVSSEGPVNFIAPHPLCDCPGKR